MQRVPKHHNFRCLFPAGGGGAEPVIIALQQELFAGGQARREEGDGRTGL